MREQLKGQDLSFTDMAKIVGERWQILSADSREVYEKRAAATKEKYNQDLAEYKKTESYATYMEYLADFKAKNAAPQDTGKQDVIPNPHLDANSFSKESVGNKRIRLVAGESTGSNNGYDSHDSRGGKSAVFTPPAFQEESTRSTLDSRQSSRSGSYASDGQQSPRDIEEKESVSALPPYHSHGYMKTMSRDHTPSTRRPSTTAPYAAPLTKASSPPLTGVYRTHDLPFSLARPASAIYQDTPTSSVSSLPPIATAVQFDPHMYAKPGYAPHQRRITPDYGTSPHTPFQKIIDADGPRSIRTLPAPDFRRSSNAPPFLPPILPSFEMSSRTPSSLDTLLLAAKVAEKHDMPPPSS